MTTPVSQVYERDGSGLLAHGDAIARGRVNWGAIFAGVMVLAALTFLLNLLGAGIGLSFLTPTRPAASPDAGSILVGGGLWWVVSNWVAVGLGAFVAGRLAHRFLDSDGALHGLIVWAVGLVLVVWMFAAALGATAMGAGSMASAAMQGAASRDASSMDALTSRPDSPENLRTQIGRFLLDPGSVNRTDLVHAIATQAGISDAEADTRLTRFQQDSQRAAETARQVAAQAAFWSFAALLLGGVAAYFGGLWGAHWGREAEAVIETKLDARAF